MDKVYSTRLDERVVDELDRASRRLGISKRQFLEEAIRLRASRARTPGTDVWAATCGAWRRRETPAATVREARRAFESAMQRHRGRPTSRGRGGAGT